MRLRTFIYLLCILLFFACESGSDAISPSNTSVGGSLARFTIMEDQLIVIDQKELKLFNIQENGGLAFDHAIEVGNGLETLFPRGEYLFIGTRIGMYIYKRDGSSLAYVSFTEHLESCDPVVANETHAYVTLSSGRSCTFGSNLLDVYNIQDISNPTLIQSIGMEGPKGLGLTASHLYVCDGTDGFIIFKLLENGTVEEQSRITGYNAHDVIVIGNVLIVVADDNIHQYHIKETGEVVKLSEIAV